VIARSAGVLRFVMRGLGCYMKRVTESRHDCIGQIVKPECPGCKGDRRNLRKESGIRWCREGEGVAGLREGEGVAGLREKVRGRAYGRIVRAC
jgi:hypothetical protein